MTNKEKIEKLNKLFYEFQTKMLLLAKRQTKLLGKVRSFISEKKLKEIREKIKNIDFLFLI